MRYQSHFTSCLHSFSCSLSASIMPGTILTIPATIKATTIYQSPHEEEGHPLHEEAYATMKTAMEMLNAPNIVNATPTIPELDLISLFFTLLRFLCYSRHHFPKCVRSSILSNTCKPFAVSWL